MNVSAFLLMVPCLIIPDILFGQAKRINHPQFKLETALVTIVVDRPYPSSSHTWDLFADPESKVKVGSVQVGDSVMVIGWSYWLYFVKSRNMEGYMSLSALKKTNELQPIATLIIDNSKAREEQDLKNFIPNDDPIAHLSLHVNKKSIFVGECVTLRYEFNVDDQNSVPMQFYDLGGQLGPIVYEILRPKDSWESMKVVANLEPKPKLINSKPCSSYLLGLFTFCPSKAEDLYFPETTLTLLRGKRSDTIRNELVKFKSAPVSVKVKALPLNVRKSEFGPYGMFGIFELKDSFSAKKTDVGSKVNYSVVISGEGLTYPIIAPKIRMNNIISTLTEVLNSDTVLDGRYFSKKEFNYSIAFKKPGNYDFSDKIYFEYVNSQGKTTRLATKAKIDVVGEEKPNLFDTFKVTEFDNLIAIDNSQSMLIEDYEPFRLRAVTMGVAIFLQSRKICDVGIVTFAGDAKFQNADPLTHCYPNDQVNNVNVDKIKNGTAIGNAISQCDQYLSGNPGRKTIVLIGDGDNTAGNIPPEFAIKLIKKSGVKIYTIGVGNKGLVPFGKDYFGKYQMVDNTFDDKCFKKIAELTGARYFHAKSSLEIARILHEIFDNQ